MNFSGTRNSNNISPLPAPAPIGGGTGPISAGPAVVAGHTSPTKVVSSSSNTNNNNNASSSRGNILFSNAAAGFGRPGSSSSVGYESSTLTYKYVYELPYFDRKEFCRVFDENNQWETLGGGLMGYSSSELSEFGRAVYRGASPTDCLLSAWGSQNHTILELFTLCGKLCHYRGMRILRNFVDPKYHTFIKDPNLNVTAELVQAAEPSPPVSPIGEVKIQNVTPEKPYLNDSDEKKAKENEEIRVKLAESVGLLPHIPFEELTTATGKWERRNILGKGGFGTVFKGVWKNTSVAIKRMENRAAPIQSQRKQSLEELKFLNSYRHDNILPLYGYCMEGDNPLCLVYQFMPNGSLEDRLLCRQKTIPLNWTSRFNITRGVACGIQFLHSIGPKPLIHGDIKSANILLDKNFEAKVGDFGLAREMNASEHSGSGAGASYVKVSRVHGTRPYLPDEYLRSKKLSTKVDTFSFGIMLYEIITGQRAYEESRPKKFLKDIFDEVESSNIEMLKDPRAGHDNPDVFWIFVRIAKCCALKLAKERPEMVQVLKSLDGLMSQATSLRTVSSHVTGLPLLFETRPGSLMPTPTGTSTNHRLSPVEMRTPSPHWTPAASSLPPHQFQQHQPFQFQQAPQVPKNHVQDSAASPRRSPIPSTLSTHSTQPPSFIPTQAHHPQPSPSTQIGTPPSSHHSFSKANSVTSSSASTNHGSLPRNQPLHQFQQGSNAFAASPQPIQIEAHNHNTPQIKVESSMPLLQGHPAASEDVGIPTTIKHNTSMRKPLIPVIVNQSATVVDQQPSPLPEQETSGRLAPFRVVPAPVEDDDDFIPLVLPLSPPKADNDDGTQQQESSETEEPAMTCIPLITELGIKD